MEVTKWLKHSTSLTDFGTDEGICRMDRHIRERRLLLFQYRAADDKGGLAGEQHLLEFFDLAGEAEQRPMFTSTASGSRNPATEIS